MWGVKWRREGWAAYMGTCVRVYNVDRYACSLREGVDNSMDIWYDGIR